MRVDLGGYKIGPGLKYDDNFTQGTLNFNTMNDINISLSEELSQSTNLTSGEVVTKNE